MFQLKSTTVIPRKNWQRVVSVVMTQPMLTIRTTMNYSCLVQLFGLWSSQSWSSVAMSKGAIADCFLKTKSYIVLTCYERMESKFDTLYHI